MLTEFDSRRPDSDKRRFLEPGLRGNGSCGEHRFERRDLRREGRDAHRRRLGEEEVERRAVLRRVIGADIGRRDGIEFARRGRAGHRARRDGADERAVRVGDAAAGGPFLRGRRAAEGKHVDGIRREREDALHRAEDDGGEERRFDLARLEELRAVGTDDDRCADRRRSDAERRGREGRGQGRIRRAVRDAEQRIVVFAGTRRRRFGKHVRILVDPGGRQVDERRVVGVLRGAAGTHGARDAAIGEEEVLRDVRVRQDDAFRVDDDAAAGDGVQAAPRRRIAEDVHERAPERRRGIA